MKHFHHIYHLYSLEAVGSHSYWKGVDLGWGHVVLQHYFGRMMGVHTPLYLIVVSYSVEIQFAKAGLAKQRASGVGPQACTLYHYGISSEFAA